MADPTPVASVATSIPTPADISRAEKFTREAFVHAGETTADALGRGTARRRALDAALLEIDAGAKVPSTKWRRRYALMLGLERVLSEDEPGLADGTTLNPHQVDALSGTLTALLAEAQRNGGTRWRRRPRRCSRSTTSPRTTTTSPPQAVREDDDEPRRRRRRRRRARGPHPPRHRDRLGDDDDDEDEAEEESDEDAPEGRSTRTSSTRRPTTPTPTSASGSSTRPAPARPSRRWASWTRRAPAAS